MTPKQNRDRKGAARGASPDPYVAPNGPLAYFITFPTYGTWLHGDERGSVDREHNIYDTPLLAPNPQRQGGESARLRHPPVELDAERRAVVHGTIVQVADHRGWTLHALNVRSNHVHVVVTADQVPERVMNAFKSWSTRRMTEAGLLPGGAKPWVRHGSTRYLWKAESLDAACRYVCEGQGEDLNPGEATDV